MVTSSGDKFKLLLVGLAFLCLLRKTVTLQDQPTQFTLDPFTFTKGTETSGGGIHLCMDKR